jgi:hypothetical protein
VLLAGDQQRRKCLYGNNVLPFCERSKSIKKITFEISITQFLKNQLLFMKKILFPLLSIAVLFFSCKKDSDSPTPGNTFQLKINGTATTFKLMSATLISSTADNQKRLDISGTSEDGKTVFVLTIGEETAEGNGVTVGKHEVREFNDDDPNTPEDETIDSDAFVTLSFYSGSNLVTDVYAENGDITITADDESAHTVSGTFQQTLKSLNGGTDYTISDGSFNNIPYIVAN